jgi:hypothetical protein
MESEWQQFRDSVHRFNQYVQDPNNPNKTPRITIPISQQSKSLKISFPISFSPQFLRDIPDHISRHRVMATTVLSMKDMLLDKYPRLEITAIVPFPKQGQQQEDRFTGLEISGTPYSVRQIQTYLNGDDVGKFIQQTKKYYKQQEKKCAQEQIKKIWPQSPLTSTSSGKLHPYPQLLFPDNPQYKMWS